MDTVFPSGWKDMKYLHCHTCAQVFCGMDSNYLFVVLMQQERNGHQALQDFIQYVGCPQVLHSDRSRMQLGKKVEQICRNAFIPQTTTEAHHPWQNPCEWQVAELKKVAMFMAGLHQAPPKTWGYALLHAAWCINCTAL